MKGQTLSAFIKLMIFAVVTVLATAVLAVTISNRSFGATRSYSAMFTDVTGLLPGDSVRAAGVRVGTVKSIEVAGDKFAKVTFALDKNVDLHKSDLLQMRYLNLVGQRYVAIVERLMERHVAGATVFRGVLGFGAHARLHEAKAFHLSSDLPIVIECIDTEAQIEAILPELDEMIGSGLITLERARVILYRPAAPADEHTRTQGWSLDVTGDWRVPPNAG